ncbi:TonB-linked SusC/RagA family outer membrane protein [Parabacteroides sp. PM6-13]|uniref:SusC/RagA family TonB-linked outer membrane protein n=1 Tax=Parabacteroides sp. PM6-13 TaxID=1742408 RepID=UPI002475FAFD|nr:TonB-dependent receptor [Parabacteroides sp. PM6-13]MDH6343093.1 TonB-linked SusC/RagA family outer membrane protein [Parabacteroides sp. PM6-13]
MNKRNIQGGFFRYNRKSLFSGLLLLLFCLFSMQAFAQNRTIRGTIIDAAGEPVIGANVQVKGLTIGSITDVNGEFTFEAPQSGTLVISYIGYKTQELPLGQNNYNITLLEDSETLEEVVVIGYGVQKKRDLTGAITQVSSEKLMATAPTTIQEALRGKAAGVMVAGAGLNSDPMIRIRGNRSISASNDPLFVIDGIPSSSGVSTINPADVASMEVLKDASATAIYGSRGANGVILVTTKKGEEGKVSVEYSGYLSIGKRDKYRRVRNPEEYLEYLREADRKYIYDGVGGYSIDPNAVYPSESPSWEYDQQLEYIASRDLSGYVLESVRQAWAGGSYNPANLRGFNWQEAGFRDQSVSQNHSVSIRSGTKTTKLFISGSFMDNEGLTPRSFRTRYTLRMNLDQQVGKYITVGATSNFAYWEFYNGTGVGGNWNPLGTPYYSPGGSGEYGVGGDVTQVGDPALGLVVHPTGEGMLWNPFYDFTGNQGKTKRNQIDATLYAQIKLNNGLSYRANFGTNYYSGQAQSFNASESTQQKHGDALASQSLAFERGWTFENILSYSKKWGEHDLNLTAVQSSQRFIQEPFSGEALGLPIESQLYYSMGTATQQSVSSGYTQWTMMSWMGRAIYGFKDNRYMLTASLRYDGSSRLAEGHKWVAFPSASLAWRVSDEPFFKEHIEVINNLKLRAGYGKTGNSAVSPYQTIGKIGSSRYTWGEQGVVGYAPNSLSNNTLTWETTGQYNLGIDFGLFKGRLSGTIDVYQQNTYDLLMPRVLPEVSGFSSIVQNVGETQNRGLEVSLETVNFHTKDFKWTTNLQFATNKEKIVKLASGLEEDVANMWFVGYPVDTYYDYVNTESVWGYSKEDMDEMSEFNKNGLGYKPGDLRFVDLNGDYKIDDKDRQIRGQKMPKWTAGMGNTLNYKDFDLYIFMYGMFGHTVYSDPGYGHDGRMNTRYGSYWTPKNTQTNIRKPTKGDADQPHREAYWYNSGNFVRISDITFGYTLPASVNNFLGISRARFYVQLQNPFTLTNYPNNDPEGSVKATRNYANKHNAYGDPTTTKNYMLGLNLTF